jgi:hypothetical protein
LRQRSSSLLERGAMDDPALISSTRAEISRIGMEGSTRAAASIAAERSSELFLREGGCKFLRVASVSSLSPF